LTVGSSNLAACIKVVRSRRIGGLGRCTRYDEKPSKKGRNHSLICHERMLSTALSERLSSCGTFSTVTPAYDFRALAILIIVATLRSTSSSVVAQHDTLILIAVCPCHCVPPHQHVPSF